MAWTKRALVEQAYAEIGISSALDYGLTAEQMSLAMSRLDALMEALYQDGYRLTYNAPAEYNGGDLNDDSGIPPGAYEGVFLSLAESLAPTIGKQLPPATMRRMRRAKNAMAKYQSVPGVKRDTYAAPAGQGNNGVTVDNDPYLAEDEPDALSAGEPDQLGAY